jgi:hypothetical protein
VAAANGYQITSAADGTQSSVKIGGAPALATPANVIDGNCGSSYVYEYGIGDKAIELYTGISVVLPVTTGHWQVRLSDRGGVGFRNYSVPPNGGIWQIDRVIGGLTPGPAQANVVTAASFVVLINGGVCYSGGPSDSTVIY